MAKLSWGKCTVKATKLGEGDPKVLIFEPKEDSTKITGEKGAKKEGKVEGGEVKYSQQSANNYNLEFTVFIDNETNLEDIDYVGGIINDEWKVEVIPEDSGAIKASFPRATLSSVVEYTAKDGILCKMTAQSLKKDNEKLLNLDK